MKRVKWKVILGQTATSDDNFAAKNYILKISSTHWFRPNFRRRTLDRKRTSSRPRPRPASSVSTPTRWPEKDPTSTGSEWWRRSRWRSWSELEVRTWGCSEAGREAGAGSEASSTGTTAQRPRAGRSGRLVAASLTVKWKMVFVTLVEENPKSCHIEPWILIYRTSKLLGWLHNKETKS